MRWTYIAVIVVVVLLAAAGLLWALGVFGGAETSRTAPARDADGDTMPPVSAAVSDHQRDTISASDPQQEAEELEHRDAEFGCFRIKGDEMVVMGTQSLFCYRWENRWVPGEVIGTPSQPTAVDFDDNTVTAILKTEDDQPGQIMFHNRQTNHTQVLEEQNAMYYGEVLLQGERAYSVLYPTGVRRIQHAAAGWEYGEVMLPHKEIHSLVEVDGKVLVCGDTLCDLQGQSLVKRPCTTALQAGDYLLVADASAETLAVMDGKEVRCEVSVPGKQSMTMQPAGFGHALAYDSDTGLVLVSAPYENKPMAECGFCYLYQLTVEGQLEPYDVILSPKPVEFGHFGRTIGVCGGHWVAGQQSTDTSRGHCYRMRIQ